VKRHGDTEIRRHIDLFAHHRVTALSRQVLLAIDVGNTNITLGVFGGSTLLRTWRLKTYREATSDELGLSLQGLFAHSDFRLNELQGVMIASVVPPIDLALGKAIHDYLHQKPIWITPKSNLGIRNRYKHPEEVGADRLVNAVAAYHQVRSSVIVVDFGTATTFDCVNANGDYLGGVIAPGLEIAHEALATKTAKLPRTVFQIPAKALGQTTVESLQSGFFWGYVGLVKEILTQLQKEMHLRPQLIITGGLAPLIGPRLGLTVKIASDLTLQGLYLLWLKNKKA